MQIDFFNVLVTVLSLIILAIPGYILVKTKILPKTAGEVCSALVLYGCQPALVFMGFQKTSYDPQIGTNMLIVAGLTIVIHLLMIGFTFLVVKNKNGDAKRNVVRYASIFSNCGYMGFPFLQALFTGEMLGEALIYGSVVVGIFNILNWTVGAYIMSGDKKNMSIKKIVLNPTIIGTVLGFLVFWIVKVPIVDLAVQGSQIDNFVEKIIGSINVFGDMVTPLAMVVIGIRLANVKIKQLFMDKWAYFVCLNKLVVMSLITMIVTAFLPIDMLVKYTLFFLLSMPCATSTAMFAINFKSDSDSASVFVLLTTILSIIVIPLMFLVFTGVFGVVV
ncbi:MAG: AEC family transporter [Clostridia bacterium]|nr:AEC family transporter [Clostridia bacterium]